MKKLFLSLLIFSNMALGTDLEGFKKIYPGIDIFFEKNLGFDTKEITRINDIEVPKVNELNAQDGEYTNVVEINIDGAKGFGRIYILVKKTDDGQLQYSRWYYCHNR